jgi:ParB-like chromosome segregation protein Spo0J
MLNFKSTAEPAFDYSDLSAHELADLLPMIDDANFENLKADIAKNGILEPILIFEGRILDGRNRYRAGKEVGRLTPAKFKMFEGSYAEAEAYVFSTNFLRRQMTAAQKQDVICKMLDKYPNESIRQIAKRCGTSHSYVQKIKDKLNEPTPEQKEFTEFCKTWDALSELRRAEFVKSFAPDIRDLLAVAG